MPEVILKKRYRHLTAFILSIVLLFEGVSFSYAAGTEDAAAEGEQYEEDGIDNDESYIGDERDTSEEPSGSVSEAEEEAIEDETAADTEDDIRTGEIAGYFEIPGKEEVSIVAEGISYSRIEDDMVSKEGEVLTQNSTYREEGVTTDKAFPFSYTQEDSIRDYFETVYPANRDQNPYASCWAHSAAALAEFYMINHQMATAGKDTDFSELHLVWYCYMQGTASLAGDTGDTVSYGGVSNILDAGGNLDFASQTLINGRGLVTEEAAPYSKAAEMLLGSYIPEGEYSSAARLKNAKEISFVNTDLIKQCIKENGIAGASIYCASAFYNSEHNSYYCATQTGTNHAICLVGWDDDFPREYFKASGDKLPGSDGAWLVRNSWNSGDSDILSFDDYFWISYEDSGLTAPNGTSKKSAWTFDMAMPEELPENNYFYTSQIHSKSYIRQPYCANIYKASADSPYEEIRAVSFDVQGLDPEGTEYEICIYTGVDPSAGPASGKMAEESLTKGVLYLDGKYTVDLKQSVYVKNGEYFAVVLKRSDGYTACYERAYSRENGISYTVGCLSGQSYFSTDGMEWTDVLGSGTGSKRSNFVLNALTSAASSNPYQEPGGISAFDPLADLSGNELYLVKGQSFEMDALAQWRSENTEVVSINRKGVLRAVNTGRTMLKALDGRYYDVYVAKPAFSDTDIRMLSGESLILDESMFICVNGEDKSGHYKVYYYSESPSVVSVSEGRATALSKGRAIIRAVVGSKVYAMRITVTERKSAALQASEDILDLSPLQSVNLKLKGYSFVNVSWSSGNGMKEYPVGRRKAYADDVVYISPAGTLTAIGSGTTRLDCSNGSVITVRVAKPVERVIYMKNGTARNISITGVVNRKAVWTYDEAKGIIGVNRNGRISAHACGCEVIDCFYCPYPVEEGGFHFTIKVFVEKLRLRDASVLRIRNDYNYTLYLSPGEKFTLSFEQGEGYALYQDPVFRSNKALTAFADENGVIYAGKCGDAKISTRINGRILTVNVKVR